MTARPVPGRCRNITCILLASISQVKTRTASKRVYGKDADYEKFDTNEKVRHQVRFLTKESCDVLPKVEEQYEVYGLRNERDNIKGTAQR
jgi:hypothetical protein